MKKIKDLIKIILFIITVLLISIVLLKFHAPQDTGEALYKFSYTNWLWGYADYGFTIYNNGLIKSYDNSDKKRIKVKSKHLTNEELKKLKKLANEVEDKYKSDDNWKAFDAGQGTESIYSERLSKWIVLSIFGDRKGENSTKTSLEILNFTNQLSNKYLNIEY